MKIFYFAAGIIMAAQLSAQVNLSNSLSACYALNGNATDPINSLDGTLHQITGTADRNNNAGSACYFNGSEQSFIELPDSPLLRSSTAMSFGGWVNTSTSAANQYVFYTKNNVNFNFEAYSLALAYNMSGQYIFRAQKGKNMATIMADATTIVSPNTWYHVYVTVDNASMKLYVNGNAEAITPSTFSFDYETGKKVILGGSNEADFNLPFRGSLDNIRFYNRVLNAIEVAALYNSDAECSTKVASGLGHLPGNTEVISAYPNPAGNDFKLDTGGQPAAYVLRDLHGNTIASGTTNAEGVADINLQDHVAAVYFLEVSAGGQKLVKKIVKL